MLPHGNYTQKVEIDVFAKHSYSQASPKTMTESRKSVSFNPSVQVRKTLHIDDYTDEEIEAAWYTESELLMIKADIRFTVYLIESGLLQEDNVISCRRGLEIRTPNGTRLRMQNKKNAYCAVLREQDEQWEHGLFEPIFIAKAYSVASYHCQVAANTMALEDEKDALR